MDHGEKRGCTVKVVSMRNDLTQAIFMNRSLATERKIDQMGRDRKAMSYEAISRPDAQ